MAKNISLKLAIGLAVILVLLGSFGGARVHGEGGVGLLNKLPTGETNTEPVGQVQDLNEYLAFVFPLAVRLAATLAILMIVWAGFQYMFSLKGGSKGEAKERITDAVLGLLLALAAWLILNQINPDLIKLDFQLKQQNNPTSQSILKDKFAKIDFRNNV